MGSRLEENSNSVRKRIENHTFEDEEGEEYKGSKFGGFGDYFRRKKIKLQNLDAELRAQSPGKPQIFRGVVVHVNGYTQPSLNDLHKLIVTHGGGFLQYLDGKTTVTHIIASSLTPKKAVEFRRYRIVKPAWIVDCVKTGRLLPWDSYRVLDEGAGQRVLGFDNGQVVTQVNKQTRGYRDQTDASWYTRELKGEGYRDQTDASWYTRELKGEGHPSNSPRPSQFLSQRLPTPDDVEGDDLPNSNQPSQRSSDYGGFDGSFLETEGLDGQRVVPLDVVTPHTPPKTSPTLEESDAISDAGEVDNMYDPTSDQNGHETSRKRSRSVGEETPSKRRKMTAEEHNAKLLADPNIRRSTVVNPDFLAQYYRESRLHHLSTWKADLKSQLQALTAEKSASQKKQKRTPGARKYILHVDFDSFFVAVSLLRHPQYKDMPAVVAHGNGTGSEIASCNYPAREFGVKNGMWMKRALELCPDLKILPYDFPAYEEASRAFYDAILNVGGIMQSVSVDEALIDISSICIAYGGSDGVKRSEGSQYREQTKAEEVARELREEVKRRTDCNVSVGIGGNVLLAKVALRKAKPAGQYQIKPEEVLDFIGQLEVQDLPGVASSIGGKLEEIGIKFVKDVREFSKEKLMQTLGPKTGEKIWEYARGIDRAEVGDQVIRKSVSAEVNWGVRFENQEQVIDFINSLCEELSKRLLKEKVRGRQLTMKIMKRSADAPLDPPKHLGHGKCDTFNKSVVLGVSTNSPEIITREALSILKGFGFSPGELRGIGIQMTKLEPIKGGGDGQMESSQRRLQFKVNTAPKPPPPPRESEDAIQDDVETPKKSRVSASYVKFGAENLNSASPSKRPLNTLGTQFVLPSQVDPSVLAELSDDIRSKLVRQSRDQERASSPTPTPRNKPTQSVLTSLPPQSQLDPDTLNELSPSLRAEILAFYSNETPGSRSAPSSPRKPPQQQLLPQSPRKRKPLPPPPLPRRRGRPPKHAVTRTVTATAGPTLTQTNFLTSSSRFRPKSRGGASDGSGANNSASDTDGPSLVKDEEVPEPDPSFLSALPEDIRAEVLAEHRRARLRAKNLSAAAATKAKARTAPATPATQRKLVLEKKVRKPTFAPMRLQTPEALRGALKEWVVEFREEGPYEEDAGALVEYLEEVVKEERDLGKCVGLVRWLVWVVGEEVAADTGGRREWEKAVAVVKEGVSAAVRERGLGSVVF